LLHGWMDIQGRREGREVRITLLLSLRLAGYIAYKTQTAPHLGSALS
jgi:hypothetical protein